MKKEAKAPDQSERGSALQGIKLKTKNLDVIFWKGRGDRESEIIIFSRVSWDDALIIIHLLKND